MLERIWKTYQIGNLIFKMKVTNFFHFYVGIVQFKNIIFQNYALKVTQKAISTMIEKIVIASLIIGKKVVFYTIGRTYGYPRIYRRFIEFNNSQTKSKDKRRFRSDLLKGFFRLPNVIAARFEAPKPD